MRRGVWLGLLVFVAVIGALWYGQAPPRTSGAYAETAADTAVLLRSQVQTVRIWIEAEANGRVTRQAATVAFEEAEADARATAARFADHDPPAATSDPLRRRVTALGDEVVARLAEVRIAAHRGQWAAVPGLEKGLDDLQHRLDEARRAATP